MNIIGLAGPNRGELWQWVGTDQFGKSRKYQTHGPDVSESSMQAHLKRAYPNLTIGLPERIKSGQYVPPNPEVQVESHTFMYGIRDRFTKSIVEMLPHERRSLIEMAMNLPPMLMNNQRIDDPMKTAVICALGEIERTKPEKKLSIRERYQSILLRS